MSKTIAWNKDKLAALKAAYAEAVLARKDQFDFNEVEGTGFFAKKIDTHPFVTRFAHYLIEYLEKEFARNADQPKRPNNEGEEGQ
jgi:hypothetical protein